MNRRCCIPDFRARNLIAAICIVLIAIAVMAQRRNPLNNPTGFDDVVSAVSFSPDGNTLAIARGSSEPSQRFGRIELWNPETGKLRHVIKGFDGAVSAISFSPDSKTIVSASLEYRSSKIQEKARSREGTVFAELKWWDSNSGELKHKLTLPGEGNATLKLAFSPNGRELVLAESFMMFSFLSSFPPSQGPNFGNPGGLPFPQMPTRPMIYFNSDLKVLDAESGELKVKLKSNDARSISYAPDGSLIAIARDKNVGLFNPESGKEEKKLGGFVGRPNALAFSPDGRTLAVASTTFEHETAGDVIKIIGISEVKVFDARSWRELRKVNEIGAVNTLVFDPSGKFLLLGGVMRQGEKEIPGINILSVKTGTITNLPTGEDFTEAVDSLSLSGNGRFVAFRSGPIAVKLLETKDWTIKQTMDDKSVGDAVERPVSRFLVSVKKVLAVAFSGDGQTVMAETDQGEIKSWDARTGEVKTVLSEEQDDPAMVAVSGDGKSFADVGEKSILLWRSGNKDKQIVASINNPLTTALAISADGQLLAFSGGKDISLQNQNGSVTQNLSRARGEVNELAFAADGHSLAAAIDDGTIEIWNLKSARLERTLTQGSGITVLRFSPNGQQLAAATADRVITLWNLNTGQVQLKLAKHNGSINALAFSNDGQLLASGGDDRTVVIWETASGRSRRTLRGHDQTVTSLAFSPDGKVLASGSGNASVVLWEVRTGNFSRVLK